ncbi:MAG TPA: NADH-quinone oxidoreductase subunit L [Candidatus Acidoferrales bacterium]|nr:NADH-quinone oxidoreductase subunit L [Candidatus Acidoferrales bacterium]
MLYAIWLLPLSGGVLLWALGPQIRERAGWIASAIMAVAFVLTLAQFGAAAGSGYGVPLITWIPGFRFGLMLDPLSLVWTLIITGVGFLIHLYSIGYMDGDKAVARFFAYMNFFVFAMLTLVLSDNFAGLLVGWGLVGLASYFLIGFYFDRPSAVAAARKAFVINVVGDVGLLFAIFVMFSVTGSVVYSDVFSNVGLFSPGTLFLMCVAIFVGCAAKSAQVPLHTWLPDAMEGPTPVSALIHAATMVTAGVYLIARCAPLWSASAGARELVGVIGALTALTGAILGIGQWDIKRILAYSTMSQIGYMILGVGVGAYEAGVMHFFTHAFFKAQLFLASGLVIHALAGEQDVRKMGGLRTKLPLAFWAMVTGTLAICGVPGFSGFFSKDLVIYGVLMHGHPILYASAVVTAGITAYYMSRMIFVVFFGTDRTDHSAHPHHGVVPAWVMEAPVAILMVPTVFAGWLAFGGDTSPWARWLAPVFAGAVAPTYTPPLGEFVSTAIVFVVVLIGFGVAYQRYGSAAVASADASRLAQETQRMPAFMTRAFYFDDAIEVLFVKPAVRIGEFFGRYLDPVIIDGIVRDFAYLAQWVGHGVRLVQNGLVRSYAFVVVCFVMVFVAYFAVIGVPR